MTGSIEEKKIDTTPFLSKIVSVSSGIIACLPVEGSFQLQLPGGEREVLPHHGAGLATRLRRSKLDFPAITIRIEKLLYPLYYIL